MAAVEAITTDLFPATSYELPRGSTQSIDYAAQLLAMLDAAVAAAEAGTRVEALLEVSTNPDVFVPIRALLDRALFFF